MNRSFRTAALLAREPGLRVLREALLGNPLIDLAAVYTHGHLPKSDGGGPRPELAGYRETCIRAGVPLHVLDIPEAEGLEALLPAHFDLLIALSWRRILPKRILDRPRMAAINVHRGALPKYKGAEPVRQAIEAGERSVSITVHRMTEFLDEGPIIATVAMDLDPLPAHQSSREYAEAVKTALYPLYAPLVSLSLASLGASVRSA